MTELLIPKLVLDPRNEAELIELAYRRVNEASEGKLTDFRPGSPIAALIEGQAFTIAELLYYLNMLPEALALETFRLLGVTRSAGTPASGRFRFILQIPLNTQFIINPGYSVAYKDAFFILSEQLVIPPGALEGEATVTASRPGSDLNAPAFDITVTNTNVNFLNTIYNPEDMTGGSDLEEISDVIIRAQNQLRARDVIVSATDYELAAQDLLGAGSKAVAIPFLSSDKLTEAAGQVHLFLADTLGQPISLGTAQSIQAALQLKVFVASKVWVSPVVLENLNIEIVCAATLASQEIADEIAAQVYDYLSPLNYTWGEKVKPAEIGFKARQVPEVTSIDSVTINGESKPYLLPTAWTSPYVEGLVVSIMQPDGVSQVFYLGLGGDPE